MASTSQQPRKQKKASGQGEGKSSRRNHHPKWKGTNAQVSVPSGQCNVSKERGQKRASKGIQSGEGKRKQEDATLDTTRGVHVDEQVWLTLSKETRRYIQEATAAKQNKREATADFADMALNSIKRSTYEDDVLSSSARFSSTSIVPPVVKANGVPKGTLTCVADKDPTNAKAEPKRKPTASTKKDPAKSAPLIEAAFLQKNTTKICWLKWFQGSDTDGALQYC